MFYRKSRKRLAYQRWNNSLLVIHHVSILLILGGLLLPFCSRICIAQGLSLNQCIEIALKNNLTILQKRYEIQVAHYNAKATLKEMLPSLATTYSYTARRDASTIVLFGHDVTIKGHEDYHWELSLNQPVFYGGLLWNKFKEAKLDLDLSTLALDQARNQIIKEVKVAFYQVLKAHHLLKEAQEAMTRLKNQYTTVKAFYDAALRPKTDLLQSQVELKQGKLDIIQARHDLALAMARLNKLMKRPLDTPVQLNGHLKSCDPHIKLATLYKYALENRPELKEARVALAKARRRINMARSTLFPRVDLRASYSKDGVTPDVSDNPYGDHENAQIFVTATWELFSWGKTMDQINSAKERLNSAMVQLDQIKDNIRLQVKEAYLRLEQAREAVTVTDSAIKVAQEDYELHRERYKNQLSSVTDLLDSQDRLTKARTQYFTAVAAELTALANLEYAIGKEITRCTP